MDGEAGRWTTRGNIGLTPLARVMGVGSQQQQCGPYVGVVEKMVCVSVKNYDLRKGDLFVPIWARVVRGSISSELLMLLCGGGVHSILYNFMSVVVSVWGSGNVV